MVVRAGPPPPPALGLRAVTPLPAPALNAGRQRPAHVSTAPRLLWLRTRREGTHTPGLRASPSRLQVSGCETPPQTPQSICSDLRLPGRGLAPRPPLTLGAFLRAPSPLRPASSSEHLPPPDPGPHESRVVAVLSGGLAPRGHVESPSGSSAGRSGGRAGCGVLPVTEQVPRTGQTPLSPQRLLLSGRPSNPLRWSV